MNAKESSAYQQFKYRLKNIAAHGDDLVKKTLSDKPSKSKNHWPSPKVPGMFLNILS
jgi:hypothetical protein